VADSLIFLDFEPFAASRNHGTIPKVDASDPGWGWIMAGRAEAGGGFTVLDGVALVTGSAVASVHVRSSVPEFEGPGDWAWAWCLFTWLSLTSAGPYVFLVRRFFTRPVGYPKLGDKLWALAGMPWLLAAMVRTGEPDGATAAGHLDPAYVGCLCIGLALSTMVGLPLLAARYLLVDPGRSGPPAATSWTDRIGLFLTVAWPIQCAVGLVVIG
jgi:hypothetical protein